ncbi:efflux RND transporter permease subunit [Limnofasciculus baicalensis]|uniref:Efflux RND transporter permease subunit n=1 Tax=Limnofasciculus baicalensis BBK-W-15 TaxID=2699891 RepID=A0AAE3GS43_9CYAN|nr:efflux RND transporter permease subunit [Limnofasciculus baicalensis]MCP2728843.1 efflux RND transporter permease subunit [Limnofasciculus baicalensis BBK-W-15]
MSFNISEWSIRKPVPTIVLFIILTVFGWMSFTQLGIDASPNIDVPAVSVTVTQPGAGPVELETQVTKKVEDAIAGLGNIDNISSTVNDGVSSTVVNFVLGTDSDRATNDVRNAISQIRQNLPADVNEPVVRRLEFAGGAIMTYAVVSDKLSVEDLSYLVDQNISRALLSVQGVAQVRRIGGVDREIRVDLDPSSLQALGITATQVNDQIRAFNINLPGGRGEIGGSEQSIRTLGSAANVEVLKSYEITLPNGGSTTLSSLGEVVNGYGEARSAALFNGKPVVAFQILRSTGSTLVTVEEGVRKAVEKLPQTLPPDVKLELIFTRANTIRESYKGTIDDLISASVLAVIVIMLFLRNWRATLITAFALPLSIIPTFAVQKMLGYTLNSMTLLALALAIGNLVDDAVVEIENMDRHMDMGKSPFKAALDSSAEVGLAVLASAATIIAVFLPVAFMGGVPGQFFQPFGVTVAISTIFSTLVARTVTPMMGAYLLKGKIGNREKGIGKKKEGKVKNKFSFSIFPFTRSKSPRQTSQPSAAKSAVKSHPYRSLLQWSLRHKLTTIALAIAFFIGSLMLLPLIPKGFVDSGDLGLSTVSLELPPGSTLKDTIEVAKQAQKIIEKNPTVNSVLTTVGASSSGGVNQGSISIQLKPKEERPQKDGKTISQVDFEKELRPEFRQIPGARISFDSQGGRGGRKDLSIVLKSENPDALIQAANDLEKQMRSIPGLVEVVSTASLVKPEILVIPDPARAADLGVTVQAIARTASLATIGDNPSNLAKFNLPDRQIPIRVQIDPKARNDIDTIKNLQVPTKNNTLVPLISVADIKFGSGPAQIDRFDRSRKVSVDANLEGIVLGQAVAAVKQLPAMNPLPPGVVQQPAGDAKIMGDIFGRFGSALSFAVMCIYAILVLLYNNFLYPIAIMAALPLSLGGALLGLMIAQKSLGLYALIGIVLLMGIVTKNSILLVDYALINLEEGKSQHQAVINAGISRLRPILMTSLATIAGTLPLALGVGAGAEVKSPMGLAVMGGFTTSTLLTLVVVPVLFCYVDNLQNWLGRLFGGKKKTKTIDNFEMIEDIDELEDAMAQGNGKEK